MIVQCAWCDRVISQDPDVPAAQQLVSHGICEDCKKEMLAALSPDESRGGDETPE